MSILVTWFFILLGMGLLIPIIAIIVDGIKVIYSLKLKHLENIERIRMGCPTVNYDKNGRVNEIINMTDTKNRGN